MSHMEWIARWRSLLAAVVLLAVPLATDTMSDQDQSDLESSAAGAPAPLPPELAHDAETRLKPFLSSYRLPDSITFAGSTVPLNVWQVRERIEYEFYRFLADEGEHHPGEAHWPLLSASGAPVGRSRAAGRSEVHPPGREQMHLGRLFQGESVRA